jgi:hypothetical protein
MRLRCNRLQRCLGDGILPPLWCYTRGMEAKLPTTGSMLFDVCSPMQMMHTRTRVPAAWRSKRCTATRASSFAASWMDATLTKWERASSLATPTDQLCLPCTTCTTAAHPLHRVPCRTLAAPRLRCRGCRSQQRVACFSSRGGDRASWGEEARPGRACRCWRLRSRQARPRTPQVRRSVSRRPRTSPG